MDNNINNRFPDHFREFILALNKYNVEYLLIGGYAMGAYGLIRGTGDLDIYINATPENAKKSIAACIDYGISKDDLEVEMFLLPKMIGIGQPPLRIEILKKLDAIDFSFAYQRKNTVTIDGIEIKLISIGDLILLKQAAVKGRKKERDLEDLSYLIKYGTRRKRRAEGGE